MSEYSPQKNFEDTVDMVLEANGRDGQQVFIVPDVEINRSDNLPEPLDNRVADLTLAEFRRDWYGDPADPVLRRLVKIGGRTSVYALDSKQGVFRAQEHEVRTRNRIAGLLGYVTTVRELSDDEITTFRHWLVAPFIKPYPREMLESLEHHEIAKIGDRMTVTEELDHEIDEIYQAQRNGGGFIPTGAGRDISKPKIFRNFRRR